IGVGFDANTPVSVSVSAPFTAVSTTTSASGGFTAYFPINTAPSGTYIFYVQEGSNIAQLTLSLTVSGTTTGGGTCTANTTGTSLVVSPSTAAPGSTVTYSGFGFTPGAAVSLGGPTATVNSQGSFAVSYPVPSVVNGVYAVTAIDTTGRTACTLLTVSGSTSTGGATLTI